MRRNILIDIPPSSSSGGGGSIPVGATPSWMTSIGHQNDITNWGDSSTAAFHTNTIPFPTKVWSVRIIYSFTIRKISYRVSQAVVGAIGGFGIYSGDGATKLLDLSGLFDFGSLGTKPSINTNYTLTQGFYKFATVANAALATAVLGAYFQSGSSVPTFLQDLNVNRFGIHSSPNAAGGVLPSDVSVLTTIDPTGQSIPFLFFE